jgi:hypothetical protein
MRYLHFAGVLDHGGPAIRNAEGKTLVWTAGSTQGLGIDMARINCRNAVLFYDELSVLTSKAGIESSTMIPDLLTLYESGKFSNSIKSKKESYSFDPGSYTTSLIACCTDKNFKSLWGKMTGVTSGLNDRFLFLYQPEKFKDVTPPVQINFQEATVRTRQLIDKAVARGTYSITNDSPLKDRMNGENALENRQEIRAEKLALYFAIDLGCEEIDEDCIERALALIEYERAVKRKLRPSESVTKEATLQNDIVDYLLSKPSLTASNREMLRDLHKSRYGTTLWNQAYRGLVSAGDIVEAGRGTKGDPKIVRLARPPEEVDE